MSDFVNLSRQGVMPVVVNGCADIWTIQQYHPDALAAIAMIGVQRGLDMDWFAHKPLTCPWWICSGYRLGSPDPGVHEDPHCYACALDVVVGDHATMTPAQLLENQILWINTAMSYGYFRRAGLYPGKNTCHLDALGDDFCLAHSATMFWVYGVAAREGFSDLATAIKFARSIIA